VPPQTPDPTSPSRDSHPWGTTDLAAAPGPGFAPIPDPLPGPGNPDQLPSGTTDSASSGLRAPTRIDIPKAKGQAYAKIAKGLLHAVGGLINRAIAVDDDDVSFLADEDDDETIPPPLGRLAARRVPIGKDGEDFSDVEDIGQALVGLIAWAVKGVTDHLQARNERGRRKPVRGTVLAPDMDPGDEDQGDD
jgi:hypothetical protein